MKPMAPGLGLLLMGVICSVHGSAPPCWRLGPAQEEDPEGLDLIVGDVGTARYLLEFRPSPEAFWDVVCTQSDEWNYEESKGNRRCSFRVRWKMEEATGQKLARVGTFLEVTLTGAGVNGGEKWSEDVAWTLAGGYAKGGDSEAVKDWMAEEIAESLHYGCDHRGAATKGSC